VLGIMAAILASLHMQTADDLFGTPSGSPRTDRLIEASIQWAERITQKIDARWSESEGRGPASNAARQNWLEKIRASLNPLCPSRGYSIPPTSSRDSSLAMFAAPSTKRNFFLNVAPPLRNLRLRCMRAASSIRTSSMPYRAERTSHETGQRGGAGYFGSPTISSNCSIIAFAASESWIS
jgi:hypothetical protein